MTEISASPPRRGTRTFRAAWIVLASVAAAQAATTALSSKITEQAVASKAVIPSSEAPAVPKVVDPFSPSWAGKDDPHPEMRAPAGDPPPNDPALRLLQPPVPVVSMVKRAAPLDIPITDDEVLSHLDEALNLRGKGDMLGALTHLRAALKTMPDHPKLLYHTAKTMDTMGQSSKAMPLWKSLHQLGKGAGDFYVLAQERIADGPQVVNEPEEEKEGKFTVTDLKEKEVSDDAGGERVQFTAVLKKNTAESVNVNEDMMLVIHFFDSVNGRHVARSQVQQPALTCISQKPNQPLDWNGGTETFTFDYWQPDMTPAEVRKFGRCKYYGCALEVFYKNKLQDSTGTIPDLVKMAREVPLPPPDPANSLLDSAPAPVSGPQPESSLFPPAPKP